VFLVEAQELFVHEVSENCYSTTRIQGQEISKFNFESIKSSGKPAWQFRMYFFCTEIQIYHLKNTSIFKGVKIALHFISELHMIFVVVCHTHTLVSIKLFQLVCA